jgi:peptidoglycan hydrolase CwlO-like protein
MKLKQSLLKVGMLLILPIGLMTLSSCSNKITEEQLAQLQELRRQERSLQDGISNKQTELNKIRQEINMRKADMTNCQNELNTIKTRLSQWPDIWPDYKPNK